MTSHSLASQGASLDRMLGLPNGGLSSGKNLEARNNLRGGNTVDVSTHRHLKAKFIHVTGQIRPTGEDDERAYHAMQGTFSLWGRIKYCFFFRDDGVYTRHRTFRAQAYPRFTVLMQCMQLRHSRISKQITDLELKETVLTPWAEEKEVTATVEGAWIFFN